MIPKSLISFVWGRAQRVPPSGIRGDFGGTRCARPTLRRFPHHKLGGEPELFTRRVLGAREEVFARRWAGAGAIVKNRLPRQIQARENAGVGSGGWVLPTRASPGCRPARGIECVSRITVCHGSRGVVSCQYSVVSTQLSVVSCQLSVVSCQLSVVS